LQLYDPSTNELKQEALVRHVAYILENETFLQKGYVAMALKRFGNSE